MEMLSIACVCFVGWLFYGKFDKQHALSVKSENKAIENTYNALLERKSFAEDANKEDAETYAKAVKLARK